MKKLFISILFFYACTNSMAQLVIYTGLNLQGSNGTCVTRTIYTDNLIPNNLNNNIKSISLSQGFMATLAENANGTGERFSYMATKSNLNVNLSLELQNKVSFIRVLRLPSTPVRKKGAGETNDSKLNDLNVSWFYDWGPSDRSRPTTEFVPMAWGRNQSRSGAVNTTANKDSITHFLAFNEPELSGQSKIPVDSAVPLFANLLAAGYRTGSPSGKEASEFFYIDTFMRRADSSKFNVDFLGIHWYDWSGWAQDQDSSANAIFNRFKAAITRAYNKHGRPIWITEFNANRNRSDSINHQFMRLVLPWMDADPRIERYAYFFAPELPSGGGNTGPLTTAGQIWANHPSVEAYPKNLYDTRTAYADTLLAAWETSGYLQGGRDSINFSPKWVNANILITQPIKRGSGVDLPTNISSNGYWGGNDWSTSTVAAGESGNKFLTFKIKSTNNKSVNYHTIDNLKIRISSSGPTKFEIDYQIDNGSFLLVDTITGIPAVTGNFNLGPIDLSNIRLLQNIPPTSTVTFRIIPYAASINTGSFLIGNGVTDTEVDFSLRGSFAEENLVTVPLPVTLVDFNLKRNKSNILLNWQTNNEINANFFELQRSNTADNFATIATVKCNNFLSGSEYNFTDKTATNHINYYRLKIVDKDGSFKYSNILKDVMEPLGSSLEIYPSFTKGEAITLYYKNISTSAAINLLNINGQVLSTFKPNFTSGNLKIETNYLVKGTYIMMIKDKKSVLYKKFVKQ